MAHLMQQFNFEIKYKCAREMSVADALSRITHQQKTDILSSSAEEDDAFFRYVQENIQLENDGLQFGHLFQNRDNAAISNKTAILLTNPNLCIPPAIQKKASRPKHTTDPICLYPQEKDTNFFNDPYDADTEIDDIDSRVKNLYYSASTDQACATHKFQRSTEVDTDNRTQVNELTVTDSESCPNVLTFEADLSSEMEPSHSAGMSADDNPVVDLLSTQPTTVDLFKRTNYTVSDLGQLQAADKDLSPLIQYIHHGILPVPQKHSRRLLLESSEYVVIDGVLLKSRTAKSKRTKNMSHFQNVLPNVMIKTIIELYHDSPMGGHSGIQDTLHRVREHYFLKKMGQKVAEYIRSCLECQKRKQTKIPTRSGITAFRTPSAPFQVWEIDLYGPLPLSRQGSKYIFTAVDLFSKYIYAEPIAAKDAVTVPTALIHLFSLFGVCQTLISDNGSEFIAEVTRLVCS